MPRPKLASDEAVLRAAGGVIRRHGPSAFTLAQVAEQAGIAAATLVQRFGDKRGLLAAAVALENRRFGEALEEAPRAVGTEAVIDLFWGMSPGGSDDEALAEQLLWLRQDLGDPRLSALARERSAMLRQAIAARLPPLTIAPDMAARLVEAQWQGALAQWAIERQGALSDHVAESLAAWFEAVGPAPPPA